MTEHTPEHRADVEPVVGDAPPSAKVLLGNKAYDWLKFIALVVFPALGLLYSSIAAAVGLPYAKEVVAVLFAIDTFLGVVLGFSGRQYQNSDARFDGAINVENFDDEGYSNLNVRLDPEAVAEKDEVTVKVNRVN